MSVNCNKRELLMGLGASILISSKANANIIIKSQNYGGNTFQKTNNVFEIALRWRGYDEKKSNDRIELMNYFKTHLGRDIDPVKIPWCAAWLDCVLSEAGYAKMNSLWARDFLKYGSRVSGTPKKGDLVVLTRNVNYGHVGFFTRYIKDKNQKEWIGVYGGNSDGKVQNSYYSLDKILGIRRI